MNDMQLGGWMRTLPRTKASPGFTSEVLRKARSERAEVPHTPFVWRMAAAFAMAACLVAVVHVAFVNYTHRQRVVALRAEQQQLEADLAAVKKIASEAEPVVVLEDDRGTKVIMDLDSAIQPASYRNYD
jgi:hypothetical protein